MLGIYLENRDLQQLSFTKPIVLQPGETIARHKTDNKTTYFIDGKPTLRHLPEPVYRVGETYYQKEDFFIEVENKMNKVLYRSDYITAGETPLSNKSQPLKWLSKNKMGQTIARTFVKITSVELVETIGEEHQLNYRYKFERV